MAMRSFRQNNAAALLIACADYENLPKIVGQQTINSAEAVRAALIEGGYNPNRVNLLRNPDRDSVERACQTFGREEDEVNLIFFFGHAIRVSGRADGKNGIYLCLPNMDEFNPGQEGFSTGEFSTIIGSLQASQVAVFLDCCHAGALTSIDAGSIAMPGRQSMTIIGANPANKQTPYLKSARLTCFSSVLVDALGGSPTQPEYINVSYITERLNNNQSPGCPVLKPWERTDGTDIDMVFNKQFDDRSALPSVATALAALKSLPSPAGLSGAFQDLKWLEALKEYLVAEVAERSPTANVDVFIAATISIPTPRMYGSTTYNLLDQIDKHLMRAGEDPLVWLSKAAYDEIVAKLPTIDKETKLYTRMLVLYRQIAVAAQAGNNPILMAFHRCVTGDNLPKPTWAWWPDDENDNYKNEVLGLLMAMSASRYYELAPLAVETARIAQEYVDAAMAYVRARQLLGELSNLKEATALAYLNAGNMKVEQASRSVSAQRETLAKEALELFGKAKVDGGPEIEARAYTSEGSARYRLGDTKGAKEAWQSAKQKGYATWQTHLDLGRLHIEENMLDEAAQDFKTAYNDAVARQLDRARCEILLQQALLEMRTERKNWDAARNYLATIVEIGITNLELSERVDVYYALGHCNFLLEDYQEAKTHFENARRQQAKHLNAVRDYGATCLMLSEFEEAEQALEYAESLNNTPPKDLALCYLLAVAIAASDAVNKSARLGTVLRLAFVRE